MDQDRTDSMGRSGSEDTSRAEEHVRNAEENRDALEAQNRRTEAAGTGRTSEATSEAEANVHEAERNRDALEAQHGRVERTTPDDVRMP